MTKMTKRHILCFVSDFGIKTGVQDKEMGKYGIVRDHSLFDY